MKKGKKRRKKTKGNEKEEYQYLVELWKIYMGSVMEKSIVSQKRNKRIIYMDSTEAWSTYNLFQNKIK